MDPPPPRKGKVCNSTPSKYKCPSCIIPYCSLACLKMHKEIPCFKPVVPLENPQVNDVTFFKEVATGSLQWPQRPYYVDDPRHVLPQRQLQSIAASADIHNALKNEVIQQLVLSIDSSQAPELELDKAISNQVFRSFTEKILSTIKSKYRS